MLTVQLTRKWFTSTATFGELAIYDGEQKIFECKTCEDAVRGDGDAKTVSQWKVKGQSAIPYGTYPLRFTLSSKYPPRKWEICNVPGFIGIRIHAGNTPKDTEGCLLLGEYINGNCNAIVNSVAALERFEAVMKKYDNADARIEVLKEAA